MDATAVLQYLTDHPHFFEEHASLLGEVKLSSPLTGRAVSLQERQMEVMRDKYKALELRMAELSRHAKENETIAGRFHSWTQALLQVREDGAMPRVLADSLKSSFHVPQATLRLWGAKPEYAGQWFTAGASDDARIFANSLMAPYCGANNDFEAVRWLDDAGTVQSTVIIPLRKPGSAGAKGATFGLLILGSPDSERFTALMATDFLVHIGETASTALAPLVG
jgi:uncharacterized protein YigA (DUF484 family)